MKKEGNIFYEAGRLYRAAYAAAETALLEAGPAGVSNWDLFELCQEECKRQVPNLDYGRENFLSTLQDLHQRHWATFRIQQNGFCVIG